MDERTERWIDLVNNRLANWPTDTFGCLKSFENVIKTTKILYKVKRLLKLNDFDADEPTKKRPIRAARDWKDLGLDCKRILFKTRDVSR